MAISIINLNLSSSEAEDLVHHLTQHEYCAEGFELVWHDGKLHLTCKACQLVMDVRDMPSW
jgi:hypothetical protein